ncbi:fibrinogen alpha chain [Stigmatopora nigra]
MKGGGGGGALFQKQRNTASLDPGRSAHIYSAPTACVKPRVRDGRQPSRPLPGDGRCPAHWDGPPPPPCSPGQQDKKCPSGCRLRAALSQTDGHAARKISNVCQAAGRSESALRETMSRVADVYRRHRRNLVIRHVSEQKSVRDGTLLARKLTALRQRSMRLQRRLDQLKERVCGQVEALWRAQVDVDMKLRACGGSCRTSSAPGVRHAAYRRLLAQVSETEVRGKRKKNTGRPPPDMPQIKVRSTRQEPPPSEAYKSIPTVRKEFLTQFEDIPLNLIFIENAD